MWLKIPLSSFSFLVLVNISITLPTITNFSSPWQLFSSVQFSCLVVSNSLRPHELQHTRPPCPSPTLGVHSNSCPSSRWCHPAISSSVVPFSSRPQSLPASGSFPMSQLFAWGGPSVGVSASASVLPMQVHNNLWKKPLADEWIRKLWYIYTMEYYSAIKKNTFESVLMRWMKLEPIIPSEISQKKKHQYSTLTHVYGI